jgi:hypothetical protein
LESCYDQVKGVDGEMGNGGSSRTRKCMTECWKSRAIGRRVRFLVLMVERIGILKLSDKHF